MELSDRIRAFQQLGDEIKSLADTEFVKLSALARNENPWFTADNIALGLRGISLFLSGDELVRWTSVYDLRPATPQTIGVAMAGNIPLSGFHDALCVLISGNKLKAKLSNQDSVLMKFILTRLVDLEPEFSGRIQFEERLHHIDAIIATGGNNTARYFEYYFRNVPHIIRKNRSSCAILSGNESPSELASLATDVFSYFGLGCRNISKLYVPEGYDFTPLLSGWEKFHDVVHHHKYANNYDYQRGINLMNKIPFYDNGSVLLKEDDSLVSPIAVLYYEYYETPADIFNKIETHRDQLQCIVSSGGWFASSLPFGQAQFPSVTDYADGIDTLKFLDTLPNFRE